MDTLCTASDPTLVEEVIRSALQNDSNDQKLDENFFGTLHAAESRAIAEYIAEADNLIKLSDDVHACDGILGSLESVLSKFDSRLDAASDEILAYQQRSNSLFHELGRKKELREQVSLFVEALVLKPKLIRDVSSAPVNAAEFARALSELERKLEYVNEKESARNSAAYRDVAVEMERLRLTAVKRGRDFLLERIFELRQPSSNIQMQQNVLIRHRHVIKFLREHGSNAYAELRGEYCSNVSTKFMDVFKGYWACLEGMESGDRGVLLGGMVQPSSYYEYFESLFEAKGGSEDARVAFFQLKDRLANSSRRVLEAPIMPSVTKGDQVPFESIFASISRLLVDSAAHEYMFCKNFWQGEGHSVLDRKSVV